MKLRGVEAAAGMLMRSGRINSNTGNATPSHHRLPG
jgi:hypothetical protein